MRPTRSPAFELRVALRAVDGEVRARTRLCWADAPCSAAVLAALARRALEARRAGLTLVVEDGPAAMERMLLLAGLDGTLAAPRVGRDDRSGGELAG